MSKYGNIKITYNGMVFDSIAEKDRYVELLLLQNSKGDNRVYNLERQVKFVLIEKQQSEKAVTYDVDFTYIQNGVYYAEDVKSVATAKAKDYVIKRKLFKLKYPEYVFREEIR